MLNSLWLFFAGAIIGIAHVVPGVSGVTFAVIFNVYDRLIAVITLNIKKIRAEWRFLLLMGVGTVAGVLGFARAFNYLYHAYQAPTMCFFTGIIVGSLPLIYKRACPKGSRVPPRSGIVCACAALAVMGVMAFAHPDSGAGAAPSMTGPRFLFLLIAGAVSAIAMILPGISGSFILLLFGVYQPLMGTVDEMVSILFTHIRGGYAGFDDVIRHYLPPVVYITPITAGILIGTFCGAAIVRLLLKRVPRQTYGAILGLIAGSVVIVFPAGGFGGAAGTLISALAFLAGAAISYMFSLFESRREAR